MVMIGMAVGSAVIKGMGKKRARSDEKASRGKATGHINQGIGKIDEFKKIADVFAQQGQAGWDKYNKSLGSVEESVGDYIMNTDASELAAQENQTLQGIFDNSMDIANDELAINGIANAGISAQRSIGQRNLLDQQKAQNRYDAKDTVFNRQKDWMGYQAGQENKNYERYASGVDMQNSASQQYQQAYANLANIEQGAATSYAQQGRDNASYANDAWTSAGYLTNDYMNKEA